MTAAAAAAAAVAAVALSAAEPPCAGAEPPLVLKTFMPCRGPPPVQEGLGDKVVHAVAGVTHKAGRPKLGQHGCGPVGGPARLAVGAACWRRGGGSCPCIEPAPPCAPCTLNQRCPEAAPQVEDAIHRAEEVAHRVEAAAEGAVHKARGAAGLGRSLLEARSGARPSLPAHSLCPPPPRR